MSPSSIAGRTGVTDLFILGRLDDDRLFNFDGFGRGAGWAGNISVAPAEEPMLHEALHGTVVRKRSGVPFRVFGPYWASSVAIVPVADGVVVFGEGTVANRSDNDLIAAANDAIDAARETPAGKKEADELELDQAVEALEAMDTSTIEHAAAQLATLAARALSCEFGAVLLNEPHARLFMADEGWRPTGTEEEVVAALLPLQQASSKGMLVEQDLGQTAFPYPPLSRHDGLVARCAVPLGTDGNLGVLVLAHAGSAPRGFTSLCQRVASTIGVTAGRMFEGRFATG